MDLGGNAGAYLQRSIFGAAAWIVLATIPAYTATPDQLYQTWQKNSRDQPDIAEKAAEDYLHAAPAGPHAHALQVWLDAYRKALAGFLARIPQSARPGAPNARQASAQPSTSRQIAAAPPPPSASPQTRQASAADGAPNVRQAPAPPSRPAIPPDDNAPKKQAVPRSPAVPPQTRQASVGQSAPNARQAIVPPSRQAIPPDDSNPKKQAAPRPPAVPPEARQVSLLERDVPKKQPAPRPSTAPRETRLASAIPPEKDIPKKQPARASQTDLADVKPEGHSLADTLAFIADKVGSESRIDFTAHFRDPAGSREIVQQLSYKASNVTIDPNRCQLSFRWHVEQDNRALPDQDRTVELRLAKSITVETIDVALTERNRAAGHPFSVRTHPQVYAVHIARWDSRSGDNLYFHDSRMAARVGEVARRAMASCDDKDKQAFRGR